MTDHEIDRVADAVSKRVCADHKCAFTPDERAELHKVAEASKDNRSLRREGRGAAISILVMAILLALWEGFKKKLGL